MKISKEKENNISYTVIYYPHIPNKDELIETIKIVSKEEYCKVWWWQDEETIYKCYKYFKNGKLHRNFKDGFALCNVGSCFYGYEGFVFQENKHTPKELKNIERAIKINKLNNIN